jgi:hypothetical protein
MCASHYLSADQCLTSLSQYFTEIVFLVSGRNILQYVKPKAQSDWHLEF